MIPSYIRPIVLGPAEAAADPTTKVSAMFLGATEAWSIRVGSGIRLYTVHTPTLTVAIKLLDNATLSGDMIFSALRHLLRMPNDPEGALAAAGIPSEAPRELLPEAMERIAYVPYISPGELESILGITRPAATMLMAIPATSSLRRGAEIPRLSIEQAELAPVADTSATAAPDEHKHMPISSDIPTDTDEDSADEADELYARPRRRGISPGTIIITIGVVAAIAAILWYLPILLSSHGDYDNLEQAEIIASESEGAQTAKLDMLTDSALALEPGSPVTAVADSAPAVQTEPLLVPEDIDDQKGNPDESPLTPQEQLDADYLNSHQIWARADLQSESMRRFYDDFGRGDIGAILSSRYFALQGVATNARALKIADMLWAAKGSDTEKSNVAVLHKLKDKPSFKLYDLYDALGRVQPSKPNPGPRK